MFGHVAAGGNYPIATPGGDWRSFVMETVLTAILVSVILNTATGYRSIGHNAALAVGSTVALLGLFASPISGASMNPARTLGPDIVANNYTGWWVYVARAGARGAARRGADRPGARPARQQGAPGGRRRRPAPVNRPRAVPLALHGAGTAVSRHPVRRGRLPLRGDLPVCDLRRRPDEPAAMTVRGRVLRGLARVPGAATLARLTVETVRVCMRYRVTGLASEAGFFALLSLPPLLFGLFGGAGYVGGWLGPDTVAQVVPRDQRLCLALPDRRQRQGRHRPHGGRRAAATARSTSSRSGFWSRCGRARGRSTSSSTPSRSCTARAGVRGIVRTRVLSASRLYFLAHPLGRSSRSRWCSSGRACSRGSCPEPAGTSSNALYWPW